MKSALIYSTTTMLVLLLCTLVAQVTSHGRMFMPPGRSSVWRHRQFPQPPPMAPKNYNDNQQFCGGKEYQAEMNWQCGICGDPYDADRENEVGGRYVSAQWRPIVANYTAGQVATFTFEITANHQGFVAFKLCAVNDFSLEATQECLDQTPIKIAPNYRNLNKYGTNIEDDEKYAIPSGTGKFDVGVLIPSDFECGLCTMQFMYRAGNTWMKDYDPRVRQEEFYGCADIGIQRNGQTTVPVTANPTRAPATVPNPTDCNCEDSTPGLLTPPQPAVTTKSTTTTTTTTTKRPTPPVAGECVGIAPWNTERMKNWCHNNCKLNNCPRNLCSVNCTSLCSRAC